MIFLNILSRITNVQVVEYMFVSLAMHALLLMIANVNTMILLI